MNGFDIYTLIFLVIAVVIFLRLRSVLGRRTGHERPPFDPYSARESREEGTPPADAGQAGDKVITLPRGRERRPDAIEADARIAGIAEKGSALDAALRAVMAGDANFDPRQFLEGAKVAYEMIVTAFHNGDKKGLKPLLSNEVYEGFAAAIDERAANGEKVDFTFVGMDRASIVGAEMENRTAQLTVRFVSQMIAVTRGKDGQPVDDEPAAVTSSNDVWTFARDVTSSDPNWRLVATDSNSE
ncbi:MAG: Tim44 domain-containing protein [Hyphomicrobiaceae bacterium]|nr:Tim44 domain-containing protein [Hyphomicrobiaceae bacterium]